MGLPAPWTLPANLPEASPSGPALDGWAQWSASRPPATRTAASRANICTFVLRSMRLPPLQRNRHPPREDEKSGALPACLRWKHVQQPLLHTDRNLADDMHRLAVVGVDGHGSPGAERQVRRKGLIDEAYLHREQ